MSVSLPRGLAGRGLPPGDSNARRLQDADRGLSDLRSDPIARNHYRIVESSLAYGIPSGKRGGAIRDAQPAPQCALRLWSG